jgi:flagellar FliJ protein
MSVPPFRFRLERVRALRERAEEQAREELAATLSLRLRGQAMLMAASRQLDAARNERRATAGAPTTAADLVATQAYLEMAERAVDSAALDLDRTDAEVDARRDALTRAARERSVLERLKERRRAAHAADSARAEGAELDELAITRYRRDEGAAA